MKLITSLGTSPYREACYTWQGKSHITRFAPAASAHFLEVDEVVVFSTDDAEEFLPADAEKTNGEALRAALPDGCAYRRVCIPDGSDEEQLWQVFDAITEEVGRGEEVSFDVTLGFRVFPLLGMMAAVFLQSALDVRVRAVLYGAFEARDQSTAPPKAPVFDLTPMLGLLDWAEAAAHFKRSGDGRDLARLLQDEKKAIAISGGEQGKTWAGALNNFSGSLESLSGALQLIRPVEAVKAAAGLPERLEKARVAVEDTARLQPFNLLLENVTGSFSDLIEDPGNSARAHVRAQRALIGWYVERELWIQASTLAKEWLQSWAWVQVQEREQTVDDLRSREKRETFGCEIGRASDDYFDARKKGQAAPAFSGLEGIPSLEEVLKLWKDLSDLRNDLNHAGMREKPATPRSIASNMNGIYKRLAQLPEI